MPPIAYRARYCIPLTGEQLARSPESLTRPPRVLENAVILVSNGTILSVDTWSHCHLPAGTHIHDAGDVCLVPPVINAHTHVQLSSLAGKTLWHAGFVPWLRSLIPLLAEPLDSHALEQAVQDMAASGTACVGDFTGHNLGLVHAALRAHGLDAVHFAEWFGFSHAAWNKVPARGSGAGGGVASAGAGEGDGAEKYSHLPPVVAALLAKRQAEAKPLLDATIAPAGHALYSTQPEFLQHSHHYCQQQGLAFSLHLAESPEEEEALCSGTGPLVDLYAERVLPAGWRAPALRPVETASRWGLLGPHTLAVHGVRCNAADRHILAQSHTALCLCPRSNHILQVGTAPVAAHMAAGVPLCIGTDGLSSSPSLNVWEEAHVLWTEQSIAPAALLRMLTVNGAQCLRQQQWGNLEKGKKWAYCTLPAAWESDFGLHISPKI